MRTLYNKMQVYAIHEADGQDVTMMLETAYALSGGGKPGQGYPCVMIEDKNEPDAVGHPVQTDIHD